MLKQWKLLETFFTSHVTKYVLQQTCVYTLKIRFSTFSTKTGQIMKTCSKNVMGWEGIDYWVLVSPPLKRLFKGPPPFLVLGIVLFYLGNICVLAFHSSRQGGLVAGDGGHGGVGNYKHIRHVQNILIRSPP